MRGLALFLVVIVLVCVFVLIGAQNSQTVTVNFLIAQATLKLSTLMAIIMTIGVAIGLCILMTSWLALRVKLGIAKQKLKKLQNE